MKNIPQHVVGPSVRLSLPHWFAAELRYTRTAGRLLDDENTFRPDEISTLDAPVSRDVGRLTI